MKDTNPSAPFYIVMLVIVVMGLAACAPANDSKERGGAAASAKEDRYAQLTAEEKITLSDVFTEDGEDKIDFTTLEEAWGKFSEAISLNPENSRALFWKAMLKPVLESKGIIARVRPLYMKQPNGAARYALFRKETTENLLPLQIKFLMAGPADIDTDEKFYEWLDRSIVSLDALRTFIQKNKEKTMALRIPMPTFFDNRHRLAKVKGFKSGCASLAFLSSSSVCPESSSEMFPFKLNRADFEALQYGVSYQMVQLSLLYAFKLNPMSLMSGQKGRYSTKQYHESLFAGYDGSLLARNHIALVKTVIPEFIIAERYIMENQEDLCKSGRQSYDDENRPGYLFKPGICVSDGPTSHEARNLEILESIVVGRPVKLEQAFVERPVVVDFAKILDHPPTNVTPFFPAKYDDAGDPLTFDDSAFTDYVSEGRVTDLYQARLKERADCRLKNVWGCR